MDRISRSQVCQEIVTMCQSYGIDARWGETVLVGERHVEVDVAIIKDGSPIRIISVWLINPLAGKNKKIDRERKAKEHSAYLAKITGLPVHLVTSLEQADRLCKFVEWSKCFPSDAILPTTKIERPKDARPRSEKRKQRAAPYRKKPEQTIGDVDHEFKKIVESF